MICTKYEAEDFLKSPSGKVLSRVRAERDLLARDIEIMFNTSKSAEWIESMVTHDDWQSSSRAKLIEHFKDDHSFEMCKRVEAFDMLCLRVARLEREACGLTISKYGTLANA